MSALVARPSTAPRPVGVSSPNEKGLTPVLLKALLVSSRRTRSCLRPNLHKVSHTPLARTARCRGPQVAVPFTTAVMAALLTAGPSAAATYTLVATGPSPTMTWAPATPPVGGGDNDTLRFTATG